MKQLMIPEEIAKALPKGDSFTQLMQLQGKIFRNVAGRKTMRVNLAGKSLFIKQHFGVGWAEIFKNLVSFKMPILGAMTEVKAIQKLGEIGIPTTPLVAYGQQGCNPANLKSFVMTADLGDIISLEDLCADWVKNPPTVDFRRKILQAVAELAAKIHGAGLCHRDFYLCHFVLKKQELQNQPLSLHLIDLHRMLQGQPVHGKAVMKDIAGLYFSAMQSGLDAQDLAIFKQYYLPQNRAFWIKVEARAKALYSKFYTDKFQKRLSQERSALD